MQRSIAPNLSIRIANSIHDIDPAAWDALSAGQPFQSHRWFRFGEQVMQDCEPIYLLVYQHETLVGRAALWVLRNEPLPLPPGAGRALLQGILRRWPLLLCRSPLSSASGLILPPAPMRADALQALCRVALDVSRETRSSLLAFDFLPSEETQAWPDVFFPVAVSDPGTVLQNRWQNLEDYLADGNKKDRQHYKRTVREAEKRGISIEKLERVPDVSAALELIRRVDRQYGNPPNPWMRGLLENLEAAQGVWLEARQHGSLVACGALFTDNDGQLTTALGLAEDAPYAYLLLTYASLEDALQKRVRLLRWGSGAYDVKKQLGFEMEDNGRVVVTSRYSLLRFLLKRFI